jgi:GTP cyclohydrolase I
MIDKERAEKAVRELLYAIGEDPDREGLLETPRRVANMYEEIFAGIGDDLSDCIKVFQEGHEEMIIVKDIPIYSMCEHHLLPFIGVAHIAYIPRDGEILGLSKVARIADRLSKKPQLQERLTAEIADFLFDAINARGVAVVIEAEHLCMTMRGIKKAGSKTQTSALRGLFRSDAKSRAEFMTLIK